MLFQRFRKVLAVLMAVAVLSATGAVSLPVDAAVSSSLSQTYHIANYDPAREFQPKRHGNIVKYSKEQLLASWGNTNRIPTGIWGSVGEKLKIYVQADANDPLPSVFFVQHLGMWEDRGLEQSIQLKVGVNEITVPKTFADESKLTTPKAEPGGGIYLLNPYTEQEQSANVRVYIEGGDKYPFFHRGDDEREFVKWLKDYYPHYLNGEAGYHNICEFDTDHTCMTLTLTRVYDAVVKEGLSPQKAAENSDGLFLFSVETDGIEPSEYQYLYQHIKVNQPYAGAYAYFNIIGIQDNNWSCQLFSNEFSWGFPHEYGHIFDNSKRVLAEVTNNVWSLRYIFSNHRFDDLRFSKTIETVNQLETSETTQVWCASPISNLGVFLFWDLEVYYRDFMALLDDMLRDGTCGDSVADNYLKSCSKEEVVVAYSSKITGIDLTYYFTKYGYLSTTPSSAFKSAMNALKLSQLKPKIWYYDTEAYVYQNGSNLNLYTKPSLANYDAATNSMYFTVPREAAEHHLGFDIYKDGQFVTFTWDKMVSNTALTNGNYTVNAYDRCLNKYATFSFTINASTKHNAVAKIGSTYYQTLEEAFAAAPDNATIYLCGPADIRNSITISGKSVTLMPEKENAPIEIYNHVGAKKDVFYLKAGAKLTVQTSGNTDNVLIFDSQNNPSYSYFRMYDGSTLELGKGVTVRRCKNPNSGSVSYAEGASEIDLKGCIIEKNYTSSYGTFFLTGNSELNCSENTVFRYNTAYQSGGVVYAYSSERVSFENTFIHDNYNRHINSTGTISINGNSSLLVDNGTVINHNQSDWYNLYTGIYVAPNAQAVFDGHVEIDDRVSVAAPVIAKETLTGHVTIRPVADYAKENNQLVTFLGTNFINTVAKVFSLDHSGFYLDFNGSHSALTLSYDKPLVCKATVSQKNVCIKDTIQLQLNANGGSGNYTFNASYVMKNANTSSPTTISLFSEKPKGTVELQLQSPDMAKYLTVTVKDSKGRWASQNIKLNYAESFRNNSTISAASIKLDSIVTVKASATGGSGYYNYAVYYKKDYDTKWTTAQNYKANSSIVIRPAKVSTYNICVKAKDSNNNIIKKYFDVTVTR